jgi:hypothetical protein
MLEGRLRESSEAKKNFETLASHRDRRPATSSLLEPLLAHADPRTHRHLELVERCRSTPSLFARESLLPAGGGGAQSRERGILAAREGMQTEIGRLQADRDVILQARSQDSTAVRLQQLDQETRMQEELLAERKAALETYTRFAARIGLPAPRSEADFRANREKAAAARGEAPPAELEKASSSGAKRPRWPGKTAELRGEIDSLQDRSSILPQPGLRAHGRRAEVRGGLLAGELLRRTEQSEWEPAIERLHHFALCVWSRRTLPAGQRLREDMLRGRTVYFRVQPDSPPAMQAVSQQRGREAGDQARHALRYWPIT